MEPSRKKKNPERDIGWEHGQMLSGRHHWKCNWCSTEFKGGGVTRLKQHLAGGYPDVAICRKCPQEVRQLMKKHFADFKAGKERAAKKREEVERQAAEPPSYHSRQLEEEEEAQVQAAMQASLDDQWQLEEVARHRAQFGPSQYESGGGSVGGMADPGLRRTTSVRETASRGSSRLASMLGTFGSKKKSSRDIPPEATIHDLDPHAFPSRDSKQQRVDTMLKKDKKKDMWRAIGSWFHFSHIPANAADNTYYRSAISAIQAAGPGVDPPGSNAIHGELLDSNKEELEKWIASYKSKWPTYGLTVMCDGWTGPTRRSIINFLTYCDTKTFFQKSIDASDKVHDSSYILRLMEEVIDQLGEENVVQVITDNGPQYKAAGEILMERRPHIFWTPCAAHCIDLILMDIGKIRRVQQVVDTAQSITRFLYNHTWVLSLMRRHTGGEILRPGVTRFATNYIALDSILQKKAALRQMFVSPEWQGSRFARHGTEGHTVEGLVMRQTFWTRAELIVKAIKPLYEVLRAVDSERYPQMGFLYHMMQRARTQIEEADPRHAQEYIRIIERRWEYQMRRDLHLAAYYLNPRFQYTTPGMDMDDELLGALRNVIYKMEHDPEVAALCLEETKLFREGTDSFGVSAAVVSKKTMNPAEWWIHFGTSTRNLKRLAVRILSQTVSSSGCERNWSTFALIHSKRRNRLTQQRLNDLVYVHYNLRLRLKCIQQEVELKYADPIYTSFADDEDDPMMGWFVGQQEEPVLDEAGSPRRPASFVASETRVDAGQWADRNIPRSVPADQPQPQGSAGSWSSEDSLFETSSQRRQPQRGTKGKGRRAAAPLASVEESVHSDSETRSGSDDSSGDHGSAGQGGSGGYETTVSETQPQGGARFTGESQYTHATQDEDHGGRFGRASGPTISYRRRAPRGRSGGHNAAADDLARGVGSIDVSGSESYTGSYYPQPQAAYDPYGYGTSEASSSSGYYPIQPGASYGSDFAGAGGIFEWAPPQPYYPSEDTSQSQSFSERSESAYNPERIPYGMNLQEYSAAWIEGWTDVPPDYINDPDIYEAHRHSTRF